MSMRKNDLESLVADQGLIIQALSNQLKDLANELEESASQKDFWEQEAKENLELFLEATELLESLKDRSRLYQDRLLALMEPSSRLVELLQDIPLSGYDVARGTTHEEK